ncbi:hypothetical protein Q3G72_028570 [Acer saccharum]|nr:hypothetical protein Q3G72_028570 [Acer saccharum]
MGKSRTRRQNSPKKKEKQEEEENNSLVNLPEHIVFTIIEKVPSRYLHNTFRHVCKSWHYLISSPEFAAKNIIQAKSELLLQVPNTCRRRWVYILQSLEIMDPLKSLEIKTRNIYPHIGMIRSSFNGLVLVQECEYNLGQKSVFLQVRNLFTKCCLTLPKCPSHCSHQACGVALGFDPSTKEYKVVHIYGDGFGFEIFTLGCSDNSWRTIPVPFQESDERPYNLQTFRWRDPVSVNGRVMHWYVDTKEYVVSMNMSDEKAYKTYLPKLDQKDQEIEKERYCFIELGGNLSFFYKDSSTQIDVWIMKDLHGRKWVKIHSMMMESIDYYPNSKSCFSSTSNNEFNPLPDFLKLFPVATMRDVRVTANHGQNRNSEPLKVQIRRRRRKGMFPHRNFYESPKMRPSDCPHYSCGAALGYDPVKKKFKVVHICSDGYGFEILTLGNPARWRRIPGPFQESCERPFNVETFQWSDPVSANGHILHWHIDSNEYVLSMNIRDKKTYKTYFPDIGQGNREGQV